MKNKLILFWILCLTTLSVSAQQKTAQLSGKLINFSNQVLVEDMSEFEYLVAPPTGMIIIPDSAGKFDISFKLASPNYFRVGRNILYLSPGDKLDVIIDKNKPAQGAFKGVGAPANIYLNNTPFPKAGSFLEAGKNLKLNPAETYDGIMTTAAAKEKEVDALTGVSPEFKRLEKARIKADVINSFNGVSGYVSFNKKITAPDAYIQSFNALAAVTKADYQKGFIDPSLLKLVVYRDIAGELIKDSQLTPVVQKIKDYYLAESLVRSMGRESDKSKLSSYNIHIDSIKTVAYRNAAKKQLHDLLQFGKGDVAVDFTALDLSGKKVTLSSLKGKVIYVDMWATWCGPCLAEMPHLDELKAKYKNNPNVVFLSLSIDDDNQLATWKANIDKRKAGGYQWQIDRNKLSAYNVTTIPRTLLIDKDFKIISMSAPLPSAKDLSVSIDKLLN